jgi:uncharacterized protein YndB with AHSA1/START domain
MPDPTVVHSTFVIERSYPKPPERVFLALADPSQKRRWYAGSETREVEQFEMDFRIGGSERLSYRLNSSSPLQGARIANEGTYHDIVPSRRIVIASGMSLGDKRISASLVTFELLATDKGTDLSLRTRARSSRGQTVPKCAKRAGGSCLTNWRPIWGAKGVPRRERRFDAGGRHGRSGSTGSFSPEPGRNLP